jgi:phage recombination protein Bet
MNDIKKDDKPLATTQQPVVVQEDKKDLGLVVQLAEKYGMKREDAGKLTKTLKATAFKQKGEVVISDEQLIMLLIVANRYNLNPFVKEIYAYPDKGGIVPVVGVDGWASMINNHPQLDGIEFISSETFTEIKGAKPCPEWIECVIYRKDRAKPIVIREYLDECFKNADYTTPWKSHTKRFLRHKALIQCSRVAFGFTGIHDEDEAARIVEPRDITPTKNSTEMSEPEIKNIIDLVDDCKNLGQFEALFRSVKQDISQVTPAIHTRIIAACELKKEALQKEAQPKIIDVVVSEKLNEPATAISGSNKPHEGASYETIANANNDFSNNNKRVIYDTATNNGSQQSSGKLL